MSVKKQTEIDEKQIVEEIIRELQWTDKLTRFNDNRYSPGLVRIIKKRLEQNLEIEQDIRKWAAQPRADKYPQLFFGEDGEEIEEADETNDAPDDPPVADITAAMV